MKKIAALLTLVVLIQLTGCSKQDSAPVAALPESSNDNSTAKAAPPNVVIFYVDDLGYADLSSYGAVGVETPNVDALAEEGIKYTDAHSSAATCTPSRYSLLTGQYAFRNDAAILPGDAPLIIDPDIYTLPKLFKDAGYKTAVVGKWHLGLGRGYVDWNTAVKPGPLELGFDYSFLMPATGDRVPTAYLENHHIVGLDLEDPITVSYKKEKIGTRPEGRKHPEMLKQLADDQHSDTIVNGISRIGWMAGGKEAEWRDEDFPFIFTEKAIDFIREAQDEPFMLYFPFHDIHVPRVPHDMFVGKSTMGLRGDAIVQMDWMTGRIIDELKTLGLYDNTLIVFSSDNGPVLDDGYADGAVEKIGEHNPSGPFRGGKYSAYEAGTRVPMIVTYPNGIKTAGESSALISHIDFFRSFAELIDLELPSDIAIDSASLPEVFLDASAEGRTIMLEESFTLSLREGDWKYIAPFDGETPKWLANKTIENGLAKEPQLYNLKDDLAEQNNLINQYPEQAAKMASELDAILNKVADSSSRDS